MDGARARVWLLQYFEGGLIVANLPAFPRPEYGDKGMDLRDWFAGQALAGLCADGANEKLGWTIDVFAKSAYQIADAMMEARK